MGRRLRASDRGEDIAARAAIPMARDQMALIQELQIDEWWQDVTVPMLEAVRRRLRDLMKLIEKTRRKPIYAEFADMGSGSFLGLIDRQAAAALAAAAFGDVPRLRYSSIR